MQTILGKSSADLKRLRRATFYGRLQFALLFLHVFYLHWQLSPSIGREHRQTPFASDGERSSPHPPPKPHFETFYAVFSAPRGLNERDAWRTRGLWSEDSLNSLHRNNVSLVYRFVVGHQPAYDHELRSEQAFYDDLVILDMQDGYHNLTCKLGMLMEWATFDAPFTFNTMVRMDIDVFPNPLRIQKRTKTLSAMAILGLIWVDTPVIRDREHKWYDPDYPNETYLPYAGGGSSLIRKDVVLFLGREHRQGILRYFANEDATMGMWIAGRAIDLIHDREIMAKECSETMITSIDGISPERHIQMSTNLFWCGNPCRCG